MVGLGNPDATCKRMMLQGPQQVTPLNCMLWQVDLPAPPQQAVRKVDWPHTPANLVQTAVQALNGPAVGSVEVQAKVLEGGQAANKIVQGRRPEWRANEGHFQPSESVNPTDACLHE